MRVAIVTPAPPGSTRGNRRTAQRYAGILRSLGHRVQVLERWSGEAADLLVALHAGRSAASIRAFARAHPERSIVVVLTGTDVYGSLRTSAAARRSIDLASRVVVLQPEALRVLRPSWRRKAVAILQSATPARSRRSGKRAKFDVVALGHLRAVKDPFLLARAVRLLPASSRLRVLHAGEALDEAHARRARGESARNPRWTWLGPRGHRAALELLADADAFVMSSRAEGGSIALAEAVVSGLPIVCTRIPGAIGMLGPRHPGYVPVGDVRALGRMLRRLEEDMVFRGRLVRASEGLAGRFDPEKEREAWRRLLGKLS